MLLPLRDLAGEACIDPRASMDLEGDFWCGVVAREGGGGGTMVVLWRLELPLLLREELELEPDRPSIASLMSSRSNWKNKLYSRPMDTVIKLMTSRVN